MQRSTSRSRALIALAALAALLVAAAPAAAAKKNPIYVSLGDSLAWGYTKKADGSVAQSDRDYSNLLAAKARTKKSFGKKLELLKLGCPGEDTATYLNGGKCSFTGSKSQAAAANKFIKANRSRIAFVTLSIGANNFTPCTKGVSVDIACVQKGNVGLDRDLPKIYRGLRKAAGSKIKIVTANQYDPYLALYLQGSDYRELALLTVDLAKQINGKIAAAAKATKARLLVADVFKAFQTNRLTTMTTVNGQQIPTAVGAICTLTLMCQPPPVGPDIHPTDAGYATLATTFQKTLKIK
jgi:lysophospholipase L1-like esterase